MCECQVPLLQHAVQEYVVAGWVIVVLPSFSACVFILVAGPGLLLTCWVRLVYGYGEYFRGALGWNFIVSYPRTAVVSCGGLYRLYGVDCACVNLHPTMHTHS